MEEITNSTILAIWNDIKDGGVPLMVMSAITLTLFFKPYIKTLAGYVVDKIINSSKPKIKEYSVTDVKNHQVFKDLDFWLNIGIKSLHMGSLNFQIPSFSEPHKESEDYMKAKEDIAKDILTIKFSSVLKYIKTFLDENDLSKLDINAVRNYFDTYFIKCGISQHAEMIEKGIPSEFLKKYFIYEKGSFDLMNQTIKAFLHDSTFDLTVPTRVYLVFNAINNYLTNSYNNMLYTVTAINGDLNGVEYKGHLIGVKKQHILQPPHSSYPMTVNAKLTSIMNEFGANRATVSKYYTKSDGSYVHSAVYEVCDTGIMPMLRQMQDRPTETETEMLEFMKNGTIIATDISNFNNSMACSMSARGVDAIVLVPIFEGQEFSGILALDYLSLEEFNKHKELKNSDDKLNEYAKDLSVYISYSKDYIFS